MKPPGYWTRAYEASLGAQEKEKPETHRDGVASGPITTKSGANTTKVPLKPLAGQQEEAVLEEKREVAPANELPATEGTSDLPDDRVQDALTSGGSKVTPSPVPLADFFSRVPAAPAPS